MSLRLNPVKRIGSTLGTQVRPITGATLAEMTKDSQPKGGGYYVAPSAPKQSDEEALMGYMDTLTSAYKPDPLVYEAQSAEDLRAQIEAWLRPSYERAIQSRQERTQTYRAELDADAISRGMGVSSYVTDVKGRQLEREAEDVALLESEYGAALAKTLSEQLADERERALEVAMQNRQNDYDAYMRAYNAALSMFSVYKAKGGGYSRGYYVAGAGSEAVPTTPENCEAFLSILTPEERREVYSGSTEQGRKYKAELLASVSLADYYRLMNKYRSAD